MTENRLAVPEFVPATERALSPDLQRAVQILCDIYETIDLRIETTLGAAEADFLSALPELQTHESELRQLVRFLMSDLHATTAAGPGQPLLLRFAYQDQDDLVEQLLSGAQAHLVVMQAESDVSLHANIQGSLS